LPFGNITNFIGIEDGGSRFIIPIILLVLLSTIKRNIEYVSFFIVFVVLSLITLYQSIKGIIPLDISVANFLKFVTLFLLIMNKKNLKIIFQIFLVRYSKIFLASLALSLIAYVIYRRPEFIFYDGSSMRFAGFHFELFNMVYSTILFYVSWQANKFNQKLGVFLFLILFLLSKSNIIVVYSLIYGFSYYLPNFLLHSKRRFFLITITIVLTPVFIGLFLAELEILNIFSIRKTSSFSQSGSSLYVRLYPFKLAADYLLQEPILSNFFPRGIGFFENTRLIVDDPFSFNGTGSPKALIDIGFIPLFFILVKLSKSVYFLLKSSTSDFRSSYIFLYLSSLIFISFGAGFFNFVAWFVLLGLSLRNENDKVKINK